jgi:hypothetical protein
MGVCLIMDISLHRAGPAAEPVARCCQRHTGRMPQVMELRGEVEFWARMKPLTESDDAEWVHGAHGLDTWPGAREAACRRRRRGGASRGRRLYSPAALADPRDREALREMAAHGFQVRIATAPLPQGIVIIDRRTMILTDPAPPPRPPAAPAPPP